MVGWRVSLAGSEKASGKVRTCPSSGGAPEANVVGIQSQKAGVLRLLPEGLQGLWWTRQLPAKDIPWVVGELSPQPKIDTRSGTRINEILPTLFWLFHFTITCVMLYGVLFKGDSVRSFIDEVGFYSYVTVAVGFGFPIIGMLLFLSGKKDARKLKERALALLSARASGALPPAATGTLPPTSTAPPPAYEGHNI